MSNLFLFDVDGTLAESTQKIEDSNLKILHELSKNNTICLISGGTYPKLISQIGKQNEHIFEYIFSENGLVTYQKGKLIEKNNIKDQLTENEIQEVINICLDYIIKLKIPYKRGRFINFRNSMIYVSPTGSDVTLEERNNFADYDQIHNIRKNMIQYLTNKFSKKFNLEIKLGGQIGIAIHPINWDKTFCLKFINLNKYQDVFFFGDRVTPDGNDYSLYSHKNIIGYGVKNPKHTFDILKQLMKNI